MRGPGGSSGWRAGNVPLPEAHLIGVAAALGLNRLCPADVRGRRGVHRPAGATLIAAAVVLIARSVSAAGHVDLDRPRALVTTGPYAVSRNPMYVGWALLHLGIGVLARSAWTTLTVPAAVGWIHREIRQEERRLEMFGEEFTAYRAAVPRYLPGPRHPSGRRS